MRFPIPQRQQSVFRGRARFGRLRDRQFQRLVQRPGGHPGGERQFERGAYWSAADRGLVAGHQAGAPPRQALRRARRAPRRARRAVPASPGT